jgi:transposase
VPVLRRCDAPGRAPGAGDPKGLFTENALAWIATSKYLDGLPLYRQAALLGRFDGTDISRNTVACSIVRVGQAVQPILNLLRDDLLDAPLAFGDEPELQVLKEGMGLTRHQARRNRWRPDVSGGNDLPRE